MHFALKWLIPGVVLTLLLAGLALGLPGKAVDTARGAPDSQQVAEPETAAAFSSGGCAGCHTIPGVPNAAGQVGPNLTTIGADADTRISNVSAEAYIRQSIIDPNAFLAPQCPTGDCPASVMPPNFGDKLTDGEVDLIVAYLLTLTGKDVAVPALYELVPIEIVRPPEADVTPFAEPPKTYSDAEVVLGKQLFFDPRLSGDATVSCASCHQPDNAWTDGQALSDGYPSTLYFRNTPTIMNTVYQNNLYWDGRMNGSDMPTLVRDHLTEAHFMNADGRLMVERVKQVPEYVQLFEEAYGTYPSFGRVLNAITAYVQSVNSGLSPYDRFVAGDTSALSPEAQAGLDLFIDSGCASCHNGTTLSDGEFYALELPQNPDIWSDPLRHITFRRFFRQLGTPNYRALDVDPGLGALTQDSADRGAFRTAPLREVARTAPYMHNGMFTTLEDVLRFYNAGAATDGIPLGLTDAEIAQMVAFLESLSSDPISVEIPTIPDYQLRTLGDNR